MVLKPFNQSYIQGQAMNPRGKTIIPDSETHLTILFQIYENTAYKKKCKQFYKVSTTLSNTEPKRQKEEKNKTHTHRLVC